MECESCKELELYQLGSVTICIIFSSRTALGDAGQKLAVSLSKVSRKLADSWLKVGRMLVVSWQKVGCKLAESWL